MKLTKYFMPVAAVALLASCSDDKGVSAPEQNSGLANAYARISISMPTGTRAGEFDPGDEEGNEATVSSIHLALYDALGRYVGSGDLADDGGNFNIQGTQDNNVSDKYSRVFKISLQEGAEDPTQVVAFINCDLQTKNLSELENGLEVEVDGIAEAKNFPMTNSGYYDNSGKFTIAAPITVDLYTDPVEAKNGSVNSTIYVERLATKITVKTAASVDQTELDYKVVDLAGESIDMTFTATNWAPTGTATSEYIVKTPFNDYKDEKWVTGVNRSYWAEGVNYGKGFGDYYASGATTGLLKYITFGDIYNSDEDSYDLGQLGGIGEVAQYAPEHTTNLGGENENLIANTYALVVGNYSLSGKNASWFKDGETLYFYLLSAGFDDNDNKKIYTMYNKSQIIGYLLSLNGVKKVGTDGSSLNQDTDLKDNDSFDFTQYADVEANEKGQYVLKATAGSEGLYVSETETLADKIGDYTTPTNSQCYRYEDGAAYFNALIQHAETDEDSTPVYGVVRNHSYVLTINKIQHLGAPIDDKGKGGEDNNDPIIPDPDKMKEHYIKAEINVLSWHTVENGVIL